MGYLSGTPGALLENLKVVMASLHARVAWVQDGHRHYSLDHLLEVGKTLADMSFIAFSCVFHDILRLGVRPFVLQVQGVLEPAVFMSCQRKAVKYLSCARQQLIRVRALLRVVALLRQHAPLRDLANFLMAYRWSPMGCAFPTLFEALPGFLAQTPTFRGAFSHSFRKQQLEFTCFGSRL